MSPSERHSSRPLGSGGDADRLLDFVRATAKAHPWIHKVTLFGSRGRGDHHDRSDYDLAFETDAISRNEWISFKLAFDEKAPTLHGYDLVWMAELKDEGLRVDIQRTGRTIYERDDS